MEDGFSIQVKQFLDKQIKMTHRLLCYNGI